MVSLRFKKKIALGFCLLVGSALLLFTWRVAGPLVAGVALGSLFGSAVTALFWKKVFK